MRILLLDGNENQAVACARSLGRAGHRVEVGASQSWSKAGLSRFARARFRYPCPETAPTDFVAFLAARAAKVPGTLVLPLTERATLPISASREAFFEAGARLVLPSHANLLRAFDKRQTTYLAREVGLQTPLTLHLETIEEACEAAKDFPFPAVLKPRASQELDAQTGLMHATGAPLYARDAAGFLEAFAEIQKRTSAVIAQSWIDGQGGGYFALMNHGRLRAEFAHRRLRDVRPTGSGSALRESALPDPKMRAGALAMLEKLEWHGVAMVEFRLPEGKEPVFLEINGRFWNSLALAVGAGVDFPLLLAQIAEFGDVESPMPPYSSGVKCRWLLGDTRHLIEVLRGPPPGFPGRFPSPKQALLDFVRPDFGALSDNFEATDPLPELGDWLDFAFHRVLSRTSNPKKSTPKKSTPKTPKMISSPIQNPARTPLLGALHLHSTYSDGEWSLAQLRDLLMAQGCVFACLTDHAESFDDAKLAAYLAELESLSDAEFRFVPGLETACGRLHILGYGLTQLIGSTDPDEVVAAIKAADAVCVVAHPQERFFERITALKNLPHGIEIWNSKYDGRYAPRPAAFRLLRRLQARDASIRGFFGQDLHWKKQFRGLFCALDCPELSQTAILEALQRGDFHGVHGQIELPASGVLAPDARVRLKRALVASKLLRRAATQSAKIGKSVPAPLKAQLRRLF